MTEQDLIPLDQHHRLTAGPAPWTDTRVPAQAFHAARAAFGTESWEDDQRVYRTLQAALVTLAPAEPDMRHPKIQALIGAKARREIELQLVEQLLDEGPDCDLTSLDMEYWHGLHDKLRDRLAAAQRPTA